MIYALIMTALTLVALFCIIGAIHCWDKED